jgi:hypothetical protein
LKERAAKQRTHVFYHLTKKLYSMDLKCFALGANHVQEIITKKHVWLSIETHFEIF